MKYVLIIGGILFFIFIFIPFISWLWQGMPALTKSGTVNQTERVLDEKREEFIDFVYEIKKIKDTIPYDTIVFDAYPGHDNIKIWVYKSNRESNGSSFTSLKYRLDKNLSSKFNSTMLNNLGILETRVVSNTYRFKLGWGTQTSWWGHVYLLYNTQGTYCDFDCIDNMEELKRNFHQFNESEWVYCLGNGWAIYTIGYGQ